MKCLQSRIMIALLCLGAFETSTAFPQGTAFTYQGRLNDGGALANGTYGLTFTLFATDASGAAIAGPVTNSATAVSNGLFMTTIDFGPGVFNGSTNLWLEIGVRANGGGAFTNLVPRQQITPAPYAIFANTASNVSGTVSSASISGTYGNALTLNNANNVFNGSFSGNGANVTNVNAAALNGLTASSFWQLGGNAVAGGQFLGSTNNQPVELRVGNVRALLMTTNPADAPNLIGGAAVNTIDAGVEGAVIAGGGTLNFLGQPSTNHISASFSSIGGGSGNWIQSGADHGFIGSGWNNLIGGGDYQSVIGGGQNNSNSATYSVLGGGYQNSIQTAADDSFLGGGYENTVQTGAIYSVLGGGFQNSIQTNAHRSFLGGGINNSIQTGAFWSVLGGGFQNSIQPNASDSFLGGGQNNSIQPNASVSFLGGGLQNSIQTNAQYSVLGGGEGNSIQPNAFYSVLGGGEENLIYTGAKGSFIGGGYLNSIQANATNSAVVGGSYNSIYPAYSLIGGGSGNSIQQDASVYSVIAGGFQNFISGSYGCFLGGGYNNSIDEVAYWSVLGGGTHNYIGIYAFGSVLAGGVQNSIQEYASYSVLAGGQYNTNSGYYSIIPGGYGNTAANYALAAGYNAHAVNNGAFVWSDGTGTLTASAANNQFVARASGGFVFYSDTGTGGAQLAAGSGTWSSLSDRNAKNGFAPVNGRTVLAEVAALPVTAWSYKTEPGVRHIGPMAQDFHAAFRVGEDDKHITDLDEGGVALAAIQGLNEKLSEKDTEIQALKQQNDLLAQRLNGLEAAVKLLAGKK